MQRGFKMGRTRETREHALTHTRQQIDQVLPFLTFILSFFSSCSARIIFYSDLVNITTVASTLQQQCLSMSVTGHYY